MASAPRQPDPASLAGLTAREPDLYHDFFERSPDAILIIEGESFVDCNEATARMLRFENREDLIRRFHAEGEDRLEAHPAQFSPPRQPDGQDSFQKANEMIRLAFERGSHTFEWDHLRADGEIFPVEVQLLAINRGELRLLQVVWREIGARKKLEAELRQAQKLEAIGKLTGGIAHDFNNLLLIIQGHSAMLGEEAGDHPVLQSHIAEIERAAVKATSLTQQMLAFSRLQVLRARTLDLVELVEGMLSLLKPLVGEHIEFHTDFSPTPVPVKADPSQLEQVLVNLITNARDAMASGGKLWIRVSSGEARFGEGGRALPAARLSVEDSGCGMPAAVAERAFDPFFTTKELGKGTGLGLATVHGIVHQSGGAIEIKSRIGEGTAIEVTLPLSTEEIEVAEAAPEAAVQHKGSGTVLLVEDERGVRRLLDQVLTDAGYQVLTANDGEEALELLTKRGGEVDALVTDVVMPRLGGPELANRVRQDFPEVRVLLMSGFIRDSPVDLAAIAREYPLLEKPFRPAQLLEMVQKLLS